MTKIEALEARVAELERLVSELRARPPSVTVNVPFGVTLPTPYPVITYPTWPPIPFTCSP